MSDEVHKSSEYDKARKYFSNLKFITLELDQWPCYRGGGTLVIDGWDKIIGIDVQGKLFTPQIQEVDKIIEILAKNEANKWKKHYDTPKSGCDIPTWCLCFYMEDKKTLCVDGYEGLYPDGFIELRKLFPEGYQGDDYLDD